MLSIIFIMKPSAVLYGITVQPVPALDPESLPFTAIKMAANLELIL